MLVKVERARGAHPDSDAAAAQAATDAIRKHILVRAQVELVDYGSLPRTDRKSRRVFDRLGRTGTPVRDTTTRDTAPKRARPRNTSHGRNGDAAAAQAQAHPGRPGGACGPDSENGPQVTAGL